MDIIKKIKEVKDKFVKKKETTVEDTGKNPKLDALMKEKQEATAKGEPWVAVLDTKINKENINNGFFELDWNNEFIEQLLDAGYKGETNEQNILQEEGLDPSRGAGYINTKNLGKDKSEIS